MAGKYTELVRPLFEEGWFNKLKPFIDSPKFDKIIDKLKEEKRLKRQVLPYDIDCFKAFKVCKYKDLKTVLLYTSPYCSINTDGLPFADGLALSYKPKITSDSYIPPATNIFLREIQKDIYNNDTEFVDIVATPNLEYLARQGVLLMNMSLTTLIGEFYIHMDLWKEFREYVFEILIHHNPGLVVLTVGIRPQHFVDALQPNTFNIINAVDPMDQYYNKGPVFSGGKYFSAINKILTAQNGKESEIRW